MVGTAAPFVRVGLVGGQGLALAIPDVTAPTVVSFSPVDNATGVLVGTDMVATMSEVVVLGAAGIVSLKKTSDNSVIQTWNVATQAGTGAGQVSVVAGNQLTMRLVSPLAATTEFYLIWDAGVVKDTSNNNIAAQASTTLWSFTTAAAADVTPPTVVSFSPLDNATGVGVAADLVATMSEAVVLGTGVITLKRTSDNVTIDSWNVATAGGSTAGKVEVIGGTALTMHLTTALANSIEHYVIWDANVVKDLANNPIAAQASTTLWSFTTVAGGFTGLLDVLGVSATRAYSTRRLRGGYAGSAIRIRRSSDNAEQDIGFVGENLDTAAVTTFVGANSAYVVKMYDQSGGAADAAQATVTQQARIVNAGTLETRSGKVTPFFDGTDDRLDAAAAAWSVKTASAVVAVNEAGPVLSHAVGILSSVSSSYIMVAQGGAAGYYGTYSVDGGNQAAPAILFGGRLHSVRYTDPTGWSTSEVMVIGNDRGFGSSYWTGWIGEVVIFATQLSAPNYTTLYQNQGAYWLSPPLLLDVLGVSATRAYSTRKLRAGYAGSAIRIRRTLDNVEQDIGFVGENLDIEALFTFASGGSGSGAIVKWYDQSGSADDCVQATGANQPLVIAGGGIQYRNGKLTALFDGIDDYLTSTSSVVVAEGSALLATTDAGPNWSSYRAAVNGPAATTDLGFIGTGSASTWYFPGSGTFNVLGVVNNSGFATVFGGVLQQIEGYGAGTTTWAVAQLGIAVGGTPWSGWIGEAVLFSTALSAGNRTAMYTNQKTYWGTP